MKEAEVSQQNEKKGNSVWGWMFRVEKKEASMKKLRATRERMEPGERSRHAEAGVWRGGSRGCKLGQSLHLGNPWLVENGEEEIHREWILILSQS